VSLPYADPTTEREWADDLLAELGAPSTGDSDPRERFLMAWETDEATFREGNVDNPLDVMPVWDSRGQPVVTSLGAGLALTERTLEQAYDQPILMALETPGTSLEDLEGALAGSNWSGFGQGSSQEEAYAKAVASDLGTGDRSAGGGATATLDAIAPGGNWDPLNWPGAIVGSATSALAGSVGVYILKGVLTLIGAGMVVYGAVVLTGRGQSKSPAPSSPGAAGSAPEGEESPPEGEESPPEPFPDDYELGGLPEWAPAAAAAA
jgi:hypothetical protein